MPPKRISDTFDSPRIAQREPKDFEMVDADFGKDTNSEVETWLHDSLEKYLREHSVLHKQNIPKWRKLYLGVPAQENKSFPWANCANTMVQVVGTEVDQLAARVLGYLYSTSPTWAFRYFAKSDSPEDADAKRRVLEVFMDTVAYEPSELDLYRIENLWFTDTAKLGTGFVKVLPEQRIEAVAVGYDSAARKRTFEDTTIYDGPRVVKLRHEEVLMNPGAQTIAESDLVAHIRPLSRKELEERAFLGFYERKQVDKILGSPDRSGPPQTEQQELRQQGIQSQQGSTSAEWDVYECWFPWFHNGHKFRLVYSYHYESRTVLRKVFNFMPNNECAIIRSKLSYSTDGAYGHGFAEMLEDYQEELSATHNQRLDASTAANTGVIRISPQLRNLDSNFQIFPLATIAAGPDEVEILPLGRVGQETFQNEEMTLRLVNDRTGVGPAVSGLGAGTVGKTKGVYSSQGTMALMQQGNSRENHRTSDFRHAHVKLGAILTAMYGKFGTGGRETLFGLDSKYLKQALDEFASRKVWIPIRATDASINREVEKQNDMLMVGLMQRHNTGMAQVMQAIANPSIPDNVHQFLEQVLMTSTRLQKQIMRDFGYDQPEDYVPEPKQGRNNSNSQAAIPGGGGGQGPLAEIIRAASGSQPTRPPSGMEPTGGGSDSSAGTGDGQTPVQ